MCKAQEKEHRGYAALRHELRGILFRLLRKDTFDEQARLI